MKKSYIKPAMTVIAVDMQSILAGSGENNALRVTDKTLQQDFIYSTSGSSVTSDGVLSISNGSGRPNAKDHDMWDWDE